MSDPKLPKSDKSSPSGYRLATHRYMVAKKQGLIEGPRTRTLALKITRTKDVSSDDSDATVDYETKETPPVRKRKRVQIKGSQGTLVTKTYVLRKDGKGMQPTKKPKPKKRRKRSFKCAKCNKHFISVWYLNQHFKDKHRPLQCSKCKRFFQTQGMFDGQFECQEYKMTFPFKSQLEQHKPSHSLDQPYKMHRERMQTQVHS